jgi:hypothetical protein
VGNVNTVLIHQVEREIDREIKVAGRLYEIIMLSVMIFEVTIQWSVVRERDQSGWKAV